jgi:hypothetical protein
MHPGHRPAVQKVFQLVSQPGMQIQRSSARGRQPHLGHQISGSLIAFLLTVPHAGIVVLMLDCTQRACSPAYGNAPTSAASRRKRR